VQKVMVTIGSLIDMLSVQRL